MFTANAVSVDRAKARPYLRDGKRYYSVTQVCTALMGSPPVGGPDSAERGQDLHAIFAISVASYGDRCAPSMVPEQYAGYHRAMLHWIDLTKPEPLLIEQPSISTVKGLPFGGTPDLLAWCRYREKRVLTLVDLKSGAAAPWHRVQVQAYRRLQGYEGAMTLRILYIDEEGNFKDQAVPNNPRDWAAFGAALSVLMWRDNP